MKKLLTLMFAAALAVAALCIIGCDVQDDPSKAGGVTTQSDPPPICPPMCDGKN